jgi:sodium transport system ATP-binding protein
VYGLIGPNGAGKTTLFRMIATLMAPDRGGIRVGGLDTVRDADGVRGAIAFSSPGMALERHFTPREIFRMHGGFHDVSPGLAEARGVRTLGVLGMGAMADTRVDRMSTGEAQKVNLAKALVHDPMAAILDEPTSGLDVPSAWGVLELIRELRSAGKAVLVSSHALPMMERICDRVGVLLDGAVRAEGVPQEVMARHGAESLEDVLFLLAMGRRVDGGAA